MNIITIGGVKLPPPSSLTVGMQDLDSHDTTRNERGYLQRNMLRENIYKIEVEWQIRKGNEIKLIESAINGASMMVTFPDSGGMVTKRMYVGDRTKEVILYNGGITDQVRWTLGFNLVEY